MNLPVAAVMPKQPVHQRLPAAPELTVVADLIFSRNQEVIFQQIPGGKSKGINHCLTPNRTYELSRRVF